MVEHLFFGNNETKPFFSLVIPVHGRLSLLEESLNSLKKLDFKDIEIIISDDSNSKRDRLTIKRWVQDIYETMGVNVIYVFTKPNLGQSKNTNQGLHYANGEWIRILHSDDILHSNIFKSEKKTIEENNDINFIFHSIINFSHSDEIITNANVLPTYNKVNAYHMIVYGLHSFCAIPSSLLFKKKSLSSTGGFNNKMKRACDWDFYSKLVIEAFNNKEQIIQFDSGMVYHRIHNFSNTNKISTKLSNYKEYKKISDSNLNFLKKHPNDFGFIEINLYKSCAFSYRISRLVKDYKSLNFFFKLLYLRKFLKLIFKSKNEQLET